MIPMMNIIAWGNSVPWAEQRQVEQDLIISRAIVDLFSDQFLRQQLRFRGGTALNKLHFPSPIRYSEDIDLVRTSTGPIKPTIDHIRERLEPWLGPATFDRSAIAPKIKFRVTAEDPASTAPIRLKLEINTSETMAFDAPQEILFRVDNPWFAGQASVPTFSRAEILATKLRALLQRNKGRDLFDLSHALDVFDGLDRNRVVECFGQYLEQSQTPISRAVAEQRMFSKLNSPGFLTDLRPLLAAGQAETLTEISVKQAFTKIFSSLIALIPGERWAQTDDMARRFDISI
jgi:predicted nucleotidyltransferase component of viral defense system